MEEEPSRFPVGFERFTLTGVLGRGSYGIVYEATRSKDDLRVALKILERSINEDREALARYFREIGSLSSIDCPNIVQFVSSGYEGGRYFLAMERIAGRSAWEAMQQTGPLEPTLVASIGADMSRALGAIGKKGLVHRDVKPANIMIHPDGYSKLVDFGLAKARAESGLTSPDEFLGTAEYIAPEVIRGADEDLCTDLYALGVTLYELLLDSNPFTSENTIDVLRRVASGRAAPELCGINADIPVALSDIIGRLMEPERATRLRDPEECERLFSALAG
jgi:serine/threonine protein kinase